jgi:hypothetical protein
VQTGLEGATALQNGRPEREPSVRRARSPVLASSVERRNDYLVTNHRWRLARIEVSSGPKEAGLSPKPPA